ncbi:MAG TPA: glycosyltransferase family 4 protein [Gaiella sp.]|nr:glycosyltransferase family 4 protein [Gaiella sp.]
MGGKGTWALPGEALVLVENLSVPFDRRVWQECRSLTRAGWRISVVCPRGTKRDTEAYEVVDGVEIHRYPLTAATGGPRGYAREYTQAIRSTRRLARKIAETRRLDIVHACNPPDILLPAVRFLRKRGAAFVFDHHDLVPELFESRFGGRTGLLYRLTRRAERETFRLADVVISTNESYRQVALRRGGKRPQDVFVVRSAPDLGRFRPVAPDASLRGERAHLLAYLGVMGPQDGVDHALRALRHLADARDDWQAIFIGEGDVLPQMKRLAAELALDGRVTFTGRVSDEDVMRILSSADVCLAPDPKNALNDVSTMNKIVEYMAMGKPVVSYDLVEARVSAGEAAVYAAPNDERAFADAIAGLLDSPERAAAMGMAGRERLATSLSWAHSEVQLLAAYERALAVRRRS